MSTQNERLSALSNLSAKTNRKKDGFDDVKIKLYDKVDESTGEIKTKARADYDPEKYVINHKTKKENIKKKASEPFVRIDRKATQDLANNEKLVYYLLTELIGWEDNFIRTADGNIMNISELSKVTGMGRKHLTNILSALESKKRLTLVDGGNVKGIYLYSNYVWYGFEKNRNDSKLKYFTQLQLTRASDNRMVVSNTNKESGVLGDNKYPPLSHQDSMIESSGLNENIEEESWIEEENEPLLYGTDIQYEESVITEGVIESSGLNEELSMDEQAVLIDRINGFISAGDYTLAQDLMVLLPDYTQERLRKLYRYELTITD